MDYLAVFIGGGLGSMLRFAISKWLGTSSTGFPYGTLAANMLSCLVMAVGWYYFNKHSDLSTSYKLMLLVGFCGGFSTFSTFSMETLHLIQRGQIALAITYVGISISFCLLLLLMAGKN